MEKFVTHDGVALPLMRSHVNTDDIIPARFLKSVRRTGFADALFANWRYLEDGRTPDPGFPLNRPGYEGASILVAGENFGCGSSREHAPWALREYGFLCVIAPSFADIFHGNCFNSGIVPITLEPPEIEELVGFLEDRPSSVHVDLPAQSLTTAGGHHFRFCIDPFRKQALAKGLDNIGWTLGHQDQISAYEQRRRQEAPWLFP
ncbi:3-isopropylmalate dehydratase small subunit [Streptomyces tendae]|uniref:3-isopropylmalate dehydratase small subunit n=1 Tax=Streptomyces tendae TaxID=1932 RepID=UPI0036909196